jgi:hypothetical protein
MRKLLIIGAVVGGVLAASPAMAALIITPDDAVLSGNETSEAEIQAIIAPVIDPATELYKSNVGGAEEGDLAGSYETTYHPEEDPTSATIVYTGGDFVGPIAWLLVKDGAAIPAWYLFNLTALGWDGTETLQLNDFWTDSKGAISHVALYGEREVPDVPEPATLALLGMGALFVGARARKRFMTA